MKVKGWYVGAVAMLFLTFAGHALAADTLLIHGHLYTGNPKQPWAESLLVSGTQIAAIGTDREVSGKAGHGARVVDLKGRTVIPGIVDSHAHVIYGGFALHGLNLSTAERSITPDKPDELVRALKAYAQAHPNDAVLFVRPDFGTAPPSTPTKELLDSAVQDRPVVVHNTSEH